MKKLLILMFLFFIITGCGKKNVSNDGIDNEINNGEENNVNNTVVDDVVDIVDVNSNSRPYAVVINNSSVAVKVQTGLQKAYMIYELPVEGGLTRLLAFYKDINELKVGTIRSARHNFLDYVFESDAIFVCYGWSHYAQDDMKKLDIDYMNGVVNSGPFYRENPEKLASEHTAYTDFSKVLNFTNTHNFKTVTTKGLVFNYNSSDVDLETKDGVKKANQVFIPSNGVSNTKYVYDESIKAYKRFVNGNPNIDYYTKEQFTAKNIIVQKINAHMASDNYYWDLQTVGEGNGYFITNGYAIPIKWSKQSRMEKTKYMYLDGSEISLSDGNVYVQLQTNQQNLTIE